MKVLFCGGGTGGHIYPALAVASRLKEKYPDSRLLYVGTEKGLEADIVPREGIDFETISAQGVLGKKPKEVVRGVAAAAIGLYQSRRILRRFDPDVVVGTGGYVCGPVVLAAYTMKIPILIQEQNVFPGWTNRLLSRVSRVTALAWKEAEKYFPRSVRGRTVVTGNPIRPEITRVERSAGIAALGLNEGRKTVFVFGGSRGALRLNEAMVEAIPRLAEEPFQVLYVTGREYHQQVLDLLGDRIEKERYGNIRIVPYLYHIENAWAAADLVVSRAGAMTLAEMTARGLPGILIPSPNVANDHQTMNARYLEREGAALVIPDGELTGPRLGQTLTSLMGDEERLSAMARSSRRLGKPEAADLILRQIVRLARVGS